MWSCMPRVLQGARRPFSTVIPLRQATEFDKVFKEGDVALLQNTFGNSNNHVLVKPLEVGGSISTRSGRLFHDDVIGKTVGSNVSTNTNTTFFLREPTLAEYITLSDNGPNPLYPAEASSIIYHLDIHPPTYKEHPPLDILQAGTGRGALTLFLARAIHGPSANKSIVHSVERTQSGLDNARKNVHQFRNGMYERNVKFYLGDVTQFLRKECQRRRHTGQPAQFLSHAVLNLPDAHSHLADIADAMRSDGILAVFSYNITRIVDCVNTVREIWEQHRSRSFYVEQVVELGAPSSGRPWVVVPNLSSTSRDRSKAMSEDVKGLEPSSDVQKSSPADTRIVDTPRALTCRPKQSYVATGGGFLALIRVSPPSAQPQGKKDERSHKKSTSAIPSIIRRISVDEAKQHVKADGDRDPGVKRVKIQNEGAHQEDPMSEASHVEGEGVAEKEQVFKNWTDRNVPIEPKKVEDEKELYKDVSAYWREWIDRSEKR